MLDSIGRATIDGRLTPVTGSDNRRSIAVRDFMFLMQYRRDLQDAKAIINTAYGAPAAARLDPDITQANTALRDAVLELEASR